MADGSISRRRFLVQGGVAAAGLAAARVAGAQSAGAVAGAGANGKVNIGCVGVGGMMGWNDLHSVAASPHARIAALCDVDANFLERAARDFPEARRYSDWREMLREEGARIDAVTVTVPDHMHCAIATAAMTAGKHVYCQKPLAHDVSEVETMLAAARKAKVVTQLGTQHASGIGDRMAVELIHGGAIGKVKEVHMWTNRPNLETIRPKGPRPNREDAVPGNFKWDLFLGTAPVRPYVDKLYHPSVWRGWQDFGTGWLGDIGCHINSAVFRALKLGAPLSVMAEVEPEWRDTPERRREMWPTWQMPRWEYAGTEMTAGKTLVARWYDGGKWPGDELKPLVENRDWPGEGALFVGEEGTLLLPHTSGPQLFPSEKFKKYPRPKLAAIDHYTSWVDACRGAGTVVAPFEIAGPMAEAVLLGTVALRVPGRELKWDAAAKKFDVEEANGYLKRKYRDGWG